MNRIDAEAVRVLASTAESQAEIARRLRVSQQAVSQAIRKQNLRPWHERHGAKLAKRLKRREP